MDDEYFGRTADESAEFEDLGALSGASDPQPLEPSPTDIAPDPATAYLTLAAIEQQTGISYVSLQRYAQQYGDRLPHEGIGRHRRYYPSAIEEFRKIKAEMGQRRQGTAGERPQVDTDKSAAPRRPKSRKKKGGRKDKGAVKKGASLAKPQRQRHPTASAGSQPSTAPAPAPAFVSDLDRLARIYQLKLQLKTLEAVVEFVTGWWSRVEAEIKELES